MSFNKRYVSKDSVITQLKMGSSLSKLLNTDALIMDDWSSNFFKNYKNDRKYQSDRKKILDDTVFQSYHSAILEHSNFLRLKNLPNILENLYLDPNWVDILLAFNILGGDDITLLSIGKFEELRSICINKIENHFNVH
jgi:hypothetical protein